MKYETKIIKIGGSKAVILPTTFLKHINGKEGSEIIIQDDEGNHGNFISIWNKDE